jgi:hypothetical protein
MANDALTTASAAVKAEGDVTELHQSLIGSLETGHGLADAVAAIRRHAAAYWAAFDAALAAITGTTVAATGPGPSAALEPSVSAPSLEPAPSSRPEIESVAPVTNVSGMSFEKTEAAPTPVAGYGYVASRPAGSNPPSLSAGDIERRDSLLSRDRSSLTPEEIVELDDYLARPATN